MSATVFSTQFTFQYVSIKTYIEQVQVQMFATFTFQYVSIKTTAGIYIPPKAKNLHSNMFLLRREL